MKHILFAFGLSLIIVSCSTKTEKIGDGIVLAQREIRNVVYSIVQLEGGKRVQVVTTNSTIVDGDLVSISLYEKKFIGIVVDEKIIMEEKQSLGELFGIYRVVKSDSLNDKFLIQITDDNDTFNISNSKEMKIGTIVDLYVNSSSEYILQEHIHWIDTIIIPNTDEVYKFEEDKL
jgi:hypothetical protein